MSECDKCTIKICHDCIFHTEKEILKRGMDDGEVAPGSNPQRLYVGEIKRRCDEVRMCSDLDDGYRVQPYNWGSQLD